MYRLIGLSGLATSGKNTVADYITQKYGHKQMMIARPVKDGVYILNPYLEDGRRFRDVIDEIGEEEAKKIPEVRRLYQVFGTDVGREMFGVDVWLRKAIPYFKDESTKYLATDLRYSNEAEAIRHFGGIVINVYNPTVSRINDHKSEDGLCSEYFDAQIDNDGTIEELYKKVDDLFKN